MQPPVKNQQELEVHRYLIAYLPRRHGAPVPYYHVVFTVPAAIADIAYQNKAVTYDLLFKTSAEAMLTIAADPEHLGAQIGITSVLHTWGSAMPHHPHIHMIVPGGGISLDGQRWVNCKPNFLLPVRALSKRFCRRLLAKLTAAHAAGTLHFFGKHRHLANAEAFASFLAPLKQIKWYVHIQSPFAGPETVLAYLSRYTHRVAIANSRLISADRNGVTFRCKNYRLKGRKRYKTMKLAPHEFIRRFLIHVLPKGLHRIRHYGLLANGSRVDNIAKARELLAAPAPANTTDDNNDDDDDDYGEPTGEAATSTGQCPCCGGHMVIIEIFERGAWPRAPPPPQDTSP